MRSGKSLWEEINLHYSAGVEGVRTMVSEWKALQGKIDPEEFDHVTKKLEKQQQLATWWRNSCISYFQQFSKLPVPGNLEKPAESLDYYMKYDFRGLK